MSGLPDGPEGLGGPDGPDGHDQNHYESSIIDSVKILYIIAIAVWIILIFILDMYHTDYIGSLILLIPVVLLFISMNNFEHCNPTIEREIFQWDILAFGVVIITIFLSIKDHLEYKIFFYRLIFVGILLVALGMVDLWLPRKELILHKHVKTIFEIFATTIFVYIFYSFYFIYSKTGVSNKNPFVELGSCFCEV